MLMFGVESKHCFSPDIVKDIIVVVLACGPLQGRQDGVEQVDHKLRSGQEECDKEYEEVCYDLLDVCPMFVREMLPYDVARLRGVPHFEVLHAGDPTGWISGEVKVDRFRFRVGRYKIEVQMSHANGPCGIVH